MSSKVLETVLSHLKTTSKNLSYLHFQIHNVLIILSWML